MPSDVDAVPEQMSLQSIPIVELIIDDGPMLPPSGIVYSRAPRSCKDRSGASYVVKGPEPSVVVAEAVAYLLGEIVGLAVPRFALGVRRDLGGQLYFASKKLMVARDIAPFIRRRPVPTLEAISRIVVFDVWVANHDRNIGNLLCAPEDPEETGGVMQPVVAIDFEKALAIGDQHAIMASASVAPRSLWPSGELGEKLKGGAPPQDMVARISAVSNVEITRAVGAVASVVDSFSWADSVVSALQGRRGSLANLVAEVWQ